MFEFIIKLFDKISNFLFALGYFSEIILLIMISIILYYESPFDTIIYIIGFLSCGFLNGFLKKWIKDPRPKNSEKFLASEQFNKSNTVYGLPSGHSQNVFYAITYLYLVTQTFIPWDALFLSISALMVYERLKFHNHTILQLIAGAAVGIIFAYGVYNIRNYIIQNI
jgi:membrane-associated phospholipid phosphatase